MGADEQHAGAEETGARECIDDPEVVPQVPRSTRSHVGRGHAFEVLDDRPPSFLVGGEGVLQRARLRIRGGAEIDLPEPAADAAKLPVEVLSIADLALDRETIREAAHQIQLARRDELVELGVERLGLGTMPD